jgi:hypothetical protein
MACLGGSDAIVVQNNQMAPRPAPPRTFLLGVTRCAGSGSAPSRLGSVADEVLVVLVA